MPNALPARGSAHYGRKAPSANAFQKKERRVRG